MSAVDEILNALPLDQLAQQFGTDQQTVETTAAEAIQSLLSGLHKNASDPQGEAALASALAQHTDDSVTAGSVDLSQVDVQDGEKIVGHVLGADPATAAQNLLGSGGNASLLSRLLPLLAPLVLSYVTGQAGKAKSSSGGSLLETILGGFGGGKSKDYQQGYQDGLAAGRQQSTTSQQGAGLGLGDLLGSMLGGGQTKQQQSGLGGLFGGLFGQ